LDNVVAYYVVQPKAETIEKSEYFDAEPDDEVAKAIADFGKKAYVREVKRVVYELIKIEPEIVKKEKYVLIKKFKPVGQPLRVSAIVVDYDLGRRGKGSSNIDENAAEMLKASVAAKTRLPLYVRVEQSSKKAKWDAFYLRLKVPEDSSALIGELAGLSFGEKIEDKIELLKIDEEEEVLVTEKDVEEAAKKVIEEKGLVEVTAILYDLVSEWKGADRKTELNGGVVVHRIAYSKNSVEKRRAARAKLNALLHAYGAFPLAQSLWLIADKELAEKFARELARMEIEGFVEIMPMYLPRETVARKLNSYLTIREAEYKRLVKEVEKEAKKARELKKLEKQIEFLKKQLEKL